jgi:hypothetical protein
MFYGCAGLNAVTLPSSIKSIGNNTFNDCISLTVINYIGAKEQWVKINFDTNWKEYSKIQVIRCSNGEIYL